MAILKVRKFLCYQATEYRGNVHSSYTLQVSERGKFKDTEFAYDTDSQLMCIKDLITNDKTYIPISNIPQMWLIQELPAPVRKGKKSDETQEV